MFCGDRCSPTDYDRRGNACDDNGSKSRRMSNMTNLASRSGLELSWWCQRPTEEANRKSSKAAQAANCRLRFDA